MQISAPSSANITRLDTTVNRSRIASSGFATTKQVLRSVSYSDENNKSNIADYYYPSSRRLDPASFSHAAGISLTTPEKVNNINNTRELTNKSSKNSYKIDSSININSTADKLQQQLVSSSRGNTILPSISSKINARNKKNMPTKDYYSNAVNNKSFHYRKVPTTYNCHILGTMPREESKRWWNGSLLNKNTENIDYGNVKCDGLRRGNESVANSIYRSSYPNTTNFFYSTGINSKNKDLNVDYNKISGLGKVVKGLDDTDKWLSTKEFSYDYNNKDVKPYNNSEIKARNEHSEFNKINVWNERLKSRNLPSECWCSVSALDYSGGNANTTTRTARMQELLNNCAKRVDDLAKSALLRSTLQKENQLKLA